ncbi:MAG: hypothetical protein AAGE86_01350 [Pseudomonadota bacterium]
MRKTAIYFGLGSALALGLGACAQEAAEETEDAMMASDVPEDEGDPIDERSDDDDDGDDGDDSDDRTGPGDRTTPDDNDDDMAPTGPGDRRAAE